MNTTANLLRSARHSAGLTQHDIAERARTAQPNVSRAESGARDISSTTVERLLHAAGFRLAALPGVGLDALSTSEHVRTALTAGDENRAHRVVIQLADDLTALSGAERVAACVAPPGPTGDRRFDALLAGVVETLLDIESLPHPIWLRSAAVLDVPWWVDPTTEGSDLVVAATPPALRERQVIIDAAELASL